MFIPRLALPCASMASLTRQLDHTVPGASAQPAALQNLWTIHLRRLPRVLGERLIRDLLDDGRERFAVLSPLIPVTPADFDGKRVHDGPPDRSLVAARIKWTFAAGVGLSRAMRA